MQYACMQGEGGGRKVNISYILSSFILSLHIISISSTLTFFVSKVVADTGLFFFYSPPRHERNSNDRNKIKQAV